MSLEHWIWMTELNISRKDKLWLAERFPSPERVFKAGEEELKAMGLSQYFIRVILKSRDLQRAVKIINYCARRNISIVTCADAAYPDRLRNIDAPPLVLYVIGKLPSYDELPTMSIVGSRNVGQREREIAYNFSKGLASKGFHIVSGMALGIDAMANLGAMDAGNTTTAVLGSGVDVCYPEQNRMIYERIIDSGGCIISEYEPRSLPEGAHFPERNRIISGLSLGVVIAAAPKRSGSLITASHALDQGRDIYVIPGGIDDFRFAGSNALIKDGAEPVTDSMDIVNEYKLRYPSLFENALTAAGKRAKYISRPSPVPQYEERPRKIKSEHTLDYNFSSLVKKTPKPLAAEENTETKQQKSDIKPQPDTSNLSETEKLIYNAIKNGASEMDDIVELTGCDAGSFLTAVSVLTIGGYIDELPGRRYSIK